MELDVITHDCIEELLDCILVHKAEPIRSILRSEGISSSGSKEELRNKLEDFVGEDPDRVLLLTEHLNRIEGWGNQHLYLYQAPMPLCIQWRDESFVRNILQQNDVLPLLNRARPIIMPDEPTLASIEWTSQRVRFIWNEKRVWHELRAERDVEEDGGKFLHRIFERKTARGTLVFDWDLRTGEAMLMIQRLQHGTSYAGIRDSLIRRLTPIIPINIFDTVLVNQAIRPLQALSDEVLERKTNWKPMGDGQVTIIHPSQLRNTSPNSSLGRVEAVVISENMQGSLGNFY